MPALELAINGRIYSVACDTGEEDRVRQLGSMLDERARMVGATASDAQRFLMISLILADELDEMKKQGGAATGTAAKAASPEAETEHELLVAAVDHLAERIDHIAAALAGA